MHKITWRGPRAQMDAAATLLTEALDADAVALTRTDAPFTDGADGVWALEAYFTASPDPDALHAAFEAFDPAWADLARGEGQTTPDIDWVAHALDGLGVVRAGRFVLYGVHDAEKLPKDEPLIPIRIDANQAFGTGHHPTTAGCLELLSRFAGFPPNNIFDLGCGSGVLAIAAAKLWERDVLAAHIDETSVSIAQENATLNGVDDALEILAADGFDAPRIEAAAPFDFVFANILAGPLVELATAMAERIAPAGRVMLAGLMAEQEPAVRSAYENAGFRLLNRLNHEVWPVLLFVKR